MSTPKKVLVLGAGVMQVKLIKKVREMGHEALVLGIKGNYPGLEFASKAIFENFLDLDKTLEVAKAEKVDAVLTCGIDLPVRTIAYVSEKMGIPGISIFSGEVVTNKSKMQECFSKGGVRTAKHRQVSTVEEAKAAISEIGLPVMFKAVDSGGSKGIIKVNDVSEAENAYEYVMKATRSSYFLVEEFLEGEEFGAQAFINKGKIKFVLPHGDYVFHGNTGVPLGHYVPCSFPQSVIDDCKEQLELCAKAARLDTCAVNIDYMLCKGKVYVLELGARCGATMLAETVSLYYGFDYYEQMIRCHLGEDPDFSRRPNGCASATMTLYSNHDGVITKQENLNPPDERLVEVRFDKKIGDHVNAFRTGIHRLGHIIVKEKTKEAAEQFMKEALAKIKMTVTPE